MENRDANELELLDLYQLSEDVGGLLVYIQT